MQRIKCLGRYQKIVLLFMAAVVLVFSILYPITIEREGFEYKDAILVPNLENGNTVYSGKIQGKQASFTVYADKTVEFRYGDRIYGPYTAEEDPTAIPKVRELKEDMTGVELRKGDEVLFRGGVLDYGGGIWLYNEDGSMGDSLNITAMTSNGIAIDGDGNVVDTMEPSAFTILSLMAGPELTHKGDQTAWFFGVFICILNAVSILFVDELFRWHLAFQIRDAERAEPSDWEVASRYIAWTVLPIISVVIFAVGLL